MVPVVVVLVWLEALTRLAGIVYCAWISHVVFGYVRELLERRKGRKKSWNNQSIGNVGPINLEMIITMTVLCLVLFTLAQVGAFMIAVSTLVRESKEKRSAKQHHEFPLHRSMQFLTQIMNLLAFLTLTVVSFERLYSTFQHTKFRLSDHTVIFVRCFLVFMVLSAVVVVVLLEMERQERINVDVVRTLMVLTSVIYAVFNGCLIYSFHSKTMSVVRGIEGDDPEDSQDAMEDDSARLNEKSRVLADAAIRITICTLIPLLSSFSIVLIITLNDQIILEVLTYVLNALDLSLNSFCVLCTFKQAKEPFYDRYLERKMQRYNLVLVWVEGLVRLLGICFGTWVCLKVFDYANQLTDRRKKTGSIRGRSNSIRQGSSNIAQIITLTVVCLAFFTLAQIGALAVDISIIVCDFYNNHSMKYYFKEDSTVSFFGWWASLFAAGAFVFISIVSFERLISTFEHTQYRVSDETTFYGRIYFLVLFLVGIGVFATMDLGNTVYFRILLGINSVQYLLLNGWLIYSFHSKTMAVVNGLVATNTASSVSVSDKVETPMSKEDSDECIQNNHHRVSLGSDGKGLALAHTGLRMTICTGLPLISSFLVALAVIGSFNPTAMLIVATVNGFDLMLNSFCVLCTFKQAKDVFYEPVLGPMHHYLFQVLFES